MQSRFACQSHWFSLPLAIRGRINRAYRAYLRSDGTLGDLRSVQAEAVEYWEQHP